ncbi:MAG: glycosyltransferase family 2 protein [Candidatus Levybacteria bacterium]|nr:glycosyltransferase family 2 protein [Candidatus Levybacteria bacterium]
MNEFPLNIALTIIVPCFNEALNLKETVKINIDDARKYLKNFEIVIVNDGSTDSSVAIASRLAEEYSNIRIVNHKKNLGLGAAILSGTKIAKYNLITYLPSDGQAYVRDIIIGLQKAKDADMVLTYRKNRSDYTLYRKFISLCLTALLKILFGLNYRDYNWVHIYKKDIFSRIKIKSKGVFFLGEVVIKAHEKNMRIVEVESAYRPRRFGKSKTVKWKTISKAFFDLLLIRLDLLYSKKIDQPKSK